MRGYTEIATRALRLDLMGAEMVWACPGAIRGVNSIMRVGDRAWRLVNRRRKLALTHSWFMKRTRINRLGPCGDKGGLSPPSGP